MKNEAEEAKVEVDGRGRGGPDGSARRGTFPGAGGRRAAAVLGTVIAGALLLAAASPPAAAAQQAERTERRYDVERGDTLWEIAGRLLDDPFMWQRIWKANRDRLQDPDLIVPGQQLVIPGRTAVGDAGDEAERTVATGDTVPLPRESLFDSGRPSRSMRSGGGITAEERPALRPVSRGDAFGAPFLATARELGPRGRLLGPVSGAGRASQAWQGRVEDEVGVRLRGLEATEGDTLVAVETGRSVGEHGRVVRPVGMLRVERARGDTAVARVVAVFGLLQSGTAVVRLPLPKAPTGTELRAADRGIRAAVVAAADGEGLLRQGGMIFLGRGASSGVRPGDVFRLLARGETAGGPGAGGTRAIVVRVRPRTSTARVVDVEGGRMSAGLTANLVQRLAAPGR